MTDPCQLLPALCNLWLQQCSLFPDFTKGFPPPMNLSFVCLAWCSLKIAARERPDRPTLLPFASLFSLHLSYLHLSTSLRLLSAISSPLGLSFPPLFTSSLHLLSPPPLHLLTPPIFTSLSTSLPDRRSERHRMSTTVSSCHTAHNCMHALCSSSTTATNIFYYCHIYIFLLPSLSSLYEVITGKTSEH